MPESPRWLLARAREPEPKSERYYQKALDSLQRLRRTKLQAARDLFLIYHQLENEKSYVQNHNRFFDLWRVDRNRRALIASIICTFFQQFCGVNVLAYYSSIVFEYAGFAKNSADPTAPPTEPSALQASLGFGILNFVFAIPAIYLIDTFGRRSLLLTTFPLMAIFHLLTGLAFRFRNTTKKVLVTLGMYLFAIAYSPGEGPVPYVYSAESMPLYVRALGVSVAIATNWLFTFVLSITFPSFWQVFTPTGTFVYYAAWCVVGFFLILLFVPETGKHSLEELDAIFSIPTRTHMQHGQQQLLYVINYYLFRRTETPRPTLNVGFEKPEIRKKEAPRKISFEKEQGRMFDGDMGESTASVYHLD